MSPLPFPRMREELLLWYDQHRRDLPWRSRPGEQPDPYHVWLSEVMLQQTRVDTVKPYYLGWVERFPTLESLAAADLDDVLKAWEGLGYYSRARNFHRAVREVVAEYGGTVPREPETFRSLPGVGRYTAGAVMSIAYGHSEPVVDGNVRRVFARVLDDPDPADGRLWEIAGGFAEGDRAGDVNQALMELGATICLSRKPDCGRCPWSGHCLAHQVGTETERPAPRRKAPVGREEHGVAVVRHDGRLLIARRPKNARLGGMWEFPGVSRRGGESVQAAAIRAAREIGGADVRIAEALEDVRHVFSHVVVTYRPFLAELLSAGEKIQESARWATLDELGDYALPAAQHRIIAQLSDTRQDQSG